MKNSRLARAMHFVNQIASFITDWDNDITLAREVAFFNRSRSRKVIYTHGMTRHCLITSDYVVKWNKMDEASEYWVNTFGGVRSEINFYKIACESGYGYLFAEAEGFIVNDIEFEVMPRIDYLGMDKCKELEEVLTDDEYYYVIEHVKDVHDENFGFLHGQPIIIDYAGAYNM